MEAGIGGTFTNHSLRATAATDLFQAGVPEKVIQEFTGHRSIKALRQYKRVDVTQKKAASNNILTGTSLILQDHNSEIETVRINVLILSLLLIILLLCHNALLFSFA